MSHAGEPVSNKSQQEATIVDDDDAWEQLEIIPNTAAVVPRLVDPVSRALEVSSNPPSIQTLQKRVETRRTLQKRLVEHPLHMFWSHFLYHLSYEFWKVDIKIRCAVLCLTVGAACKIFMMMTWYLWYPKTIFLSLILICSWIYLNANEIPRRIEAFVERVVTFPTRILETLENIDTRQARIVIMILFFVPTILQTRTILVLADINCGGGSLWTVLVSVGMSAVAAFLLQPPRSRAARDVSHIGLVTLYGAALCITLFQFKIMSLPRLAAPFFLSTGTLLLAWDENDSMEWCSALLRSALRLTLRDVLTSINNSVQEDEMLQLALLRWLVDYWSYTPTEQPSSSSTSQGHQSTTNTSNPPSLQELQWDELYPMLETATDQMTTEVQALQGDGSQSTDLHSSSQQQSEPSPGAGTAATGSGDVSPMQGLHRMLASMNVDNRAKPAVEAYKRHVEELPPSREAALLVSTLRRCPAAFALLWQILAASMFQPVAYTVMIVSMLVPMVVVEAIRIRVWLGACDSLSRMLDNISPESARQQSTATNEANSGLNSLLANIIPDADPMTILLSSDDDVTQERVRSDSTEDITAVTTQIKVPNLLLVWRNIKSSVSALEASLTAARAVQTGAVAVEFAQNLISLTSMCSEVSKQGLALGLAQLIAKEVVFHHQGDITSAPRGTETTFTYTAVQAVRNGQLVARNLVLLAEEDGRVGRIVSPIVGFFGFVGSLFDKKMPEYDGANNPTERVLWDVTSVVGNDVTNKTSISANESRAKQPAAVLNDDEGPWEATHEKINESPNTPAAGGNARKGEITPPNKDDNIPTITITTDPHEEDLESEARSDKEQESDSVVEGRSTNSKESIPDSKVELIPTPTATFPQKEEDKRYAKKQEEREVSATSTSDQDLSRNAPPKAPSDSVSATVVCKTDSDSSSALLPPNAAGTVGTFGSVSIGAESEDEINHKEIEKSEIAVDSLEVKQAPMDHKENSNHKKAKGADEMTASEELATVMDLIAEAFDRSLIDEHEKNEFCLKLSTSGTAEFVAGMKATLRGLMQETSDDGFEPLSPGRGAGGGTHEATVMDGGWSPILTTAESEEQAAIQPLDYSERLASAVQTRQELLPTHSATQDDDGIPTVESSASGQARMDDDDDNMWVKVGGGLAVLGAAVVGGAFLAMHQENPNNRHSNNQNNRTTVTIEQIDDEEETGNEWENTAANHQSQ